MIIKQFISVPEESIKDLSLKAGENNNFHKILEEGEKYKNANLTPMYLFDDNTSQLWVVSEEIMSGEITVH